MKNCFTKIFIAFIIAVTTVQCSSDDTQGADLILPKKIIYTDETFEDFKKIQEQTFTYKGRKIVKVDNARYNIPSSNSHFTYTQNYIYKGDFIAEIKPEDPKYTSDYLNFFYEDNKLKKLVNPFNMDPSYYYSEFTHNSDNTVLLDNKSMGDILLTFENDNLIKSTFITEGIYGNITGIYSRIDTYENDNLNSPFKNILGFNKLITVSLHNILSSFLISQKNNVIKKTITETNTVDPYPNFKHELVYKYDYNYNSNGYPIFCKVTLLNDDRIELRGTIQYFYE